MTRDELTELIVGARLAKGLSWRQLADAVDRPVMWTTAALLGQHPIPPGVPVDPTMYRFYEALQVHGPAIKELIHEQFGDGIMSAINFSLSIAKKPHPAGDRVVVTFDGKFLPYDWAAAE